MRAVPVFVARASMLGAMGALRRLAIAALVATLVLGCGGSGAATLGPTPVSTDAPISLPSPTPTATVTPPATVTPSRIASTLPPTPRVIDGVFTDPEGAYQIKVDPTWTYTAGGLVEGVEFWILGPPESGFTPNLNILTQRTGGMSLADYLKVTIKNAPTQVADFELEDSGEVDGANAHLGFVAFAGSAPNGRALRFLAVFGMNGASAIVATLTAPSESFSAWRATVKPFMLTLRPS